MKSSSKTLTALHCLMMATAALMAAGAPGAFAQEEMLNEAPATESTSEPTSESTSQTTSESIGEPVPQKRFVTDKLVLNVHAEAEQGSGRVATLQTGDAVDELERSGNMVRVRLQDGREGWVGANYLVSDPPAIVRLRELQRQQPQAEPREATPRVDKRLTEEIAKLKKENASLRGQVGELQARAAAPVPPPLEGETITASQLPETPAETTTLASTAPSGGIFGWLLAILLVGGASFAAGYQTLARKLRKKFGGLKVY